MTAQAFTVDARGLRCPMPTLKLQRALREAGAGAEIILLADDPLARIDVPHSCNQADAALTDIAETADGWAFRVRKL